MQEEKNVKQEPEMITTYTVFAEDEDNENEWVPIVMCGTVEDLGEQVAALADIAEVGTFFCIGVGEMPFEEFVALDDFEEETIH